MKVNELIAYYQEEGFCKLIATYLEKTPIRLQLKGLVGSLDAVIAASTQQLLRGNAPKSRFNHVFVLEDREEAAYFQNDLQNLLPQQEILLFPASFKRPYQFEEVENANVLQRSEVLNSIGQLRASQQNNFMVITYPESLAEKVINKKSLHDNTLLLRKNEEADMETLIEILSDYGFEKTDFVYEAGQYAQRGGILDVYSFAHDLPYRIEFFGNEIESLRIFEPDSQLSVDEREFIALIPNIQTKLLQEVREAFFEFIPENTCIWLKDKEQLLDTAAQYFQKASEQFQEILEPSNATQVVNDPEHLFLDKAEMSKQLRQFRQLEFGNRFSRKADHVVQFDASPQPVFNKNFELLGKHLHENQLQHIRNIISTDLPKQLERLHLVFEEIAPNLLIEDLPISLRRGFLDKELRIACYTEHQIFERYHRYRQKERYSKSKAITLKELQSLKPGDYVTHIDYGVGRFAGMEKVEANGQQQEAIRLVYRDNDLLYVNIHSLHKITRYSGKEGTPPTMSKLGSNEWENKKKRVRKKVQDIAEDLIALYAKRKATQGYAFSRDSFMQIELESSFIYEDTPDQATASSQVKEDMEQSNPMDRLVCGDVGFGKTEVAIRAAFKAVADNKQVAVLVPTTILAAQHYRTFRDRLADFPCKVDYINRFRSSSQIRQTLKSVSEGETNVLIGTHRIVGKDVKFKDLGLLIIDEEQKFGVKTKEKLKEMRVNVDVLTLTATPIPRTLHFSLMGARDLSVIATPPPNRQPVSTEVHTFDEAIIRDAISYELSRGGQVFFVHNRVKDIDAIGNIILKLVPDARVGVAHGQMEGAKLEKVMMKFIEGDYDVLLSTNIIESGLDIPNANTIIINMAHAFGLSDLHQMRGRVGRSNKKAFCYLLAPASILLKAESRKRLRALEEFSDLGDGFKVAMRDLDIRGAGNLLGAEQSGFINDLGYDTYHRILDETIRDLKATKFKDLFAKELDIEQIRNDCNIETDLEILIPEDYVSNISERLNLYTQLDNINDQASLEKFRNSLIDRFGDLPEPVKDLFETVRLRWKAESIGLEKLSLKNGIMRGYFKNDEDYFASAKFGKVIEFVGKNPQKARLKEVNQKPMIIFANIKSIQQAIEIISGIF